ncbi:MAG: hypothetical protein HY923_08885 [Elusimicrobia bacterium]|nr:hypothetical protein [Elusimicrobiota bacterium]
MSVLPLLFTLLLAAPAAAVERGFNGDWTTTYGPMTLSETSGTVTGTYINEGNVCSILGTVKDGTLEFTYREPDATGTGHFKLSSGGLGFAGEWRAPDSKGFVPWLGTRQWKPQQGDGFIGLWDTTFGPLRLTRKNGRYAGMYAYADGTLDGVEKDGKLIFRYKDVREGEGEFTLARNGRAFIGRWRADGSTEWKDWNGFRSDPSPGRKWLIVLESRWESSLDADEYTYGEMLKSFFTRTPSVQVRQRFYTDRASLVKYVREASFLSEPVVLYFSGHGTSEGLETTDGPADAKTIAAALGTGEQISLVHFGSCDIMKGKVPFELQRLLPGSRFPVSGFAQPVDWAASAINDFMYLDLILSRDLPPAKAAAELVRLMPFAAKKSSETAYDGVSFTFLGSSNR